MVEQVVLTVREGITLIRPITPEKTPKEQIVQKKDYNGKKVIVLFDLDSTLTVASAPIHQDMVDCLENLVS